MTRTWFIVTSLFLLALAGCGGSGGKPETAQVPTGSVQGRLASSGTKQAHGLFVAKVHGSYDLKVRVRSDGFFRIDNVPAGEQTITVEDPQTMQGAAVVAFVRPGQVTDVGEIQTKPLGKISGIVSEVDENGNRIKPIPRARIVARPIEGEQDTLQDLPSRPLFAAFSDANGSYELLLPEGKYLVEVSHPDYEPSAETVTVQVLQTTALDFGLIRRQDTGVVYGTVTAVVNDQTVPVAGALVALIPKDLPAPIVGETPPSPPEMTVGQIVIAMQKGKGKNHRPNPGVGGPNGGIIIPPIWWRPLFTFTNADGSYELTGVPEGEYTAIAFKSGLGKDQKEVSVKPSERVRLDFVLQARFGIVKGTVTDAETGKPIEGALVVAVRWGDPWFIWDEWEADDDLPISGDRPIWVRPMHQKVQGRKPMPSPPFIPIIEPPVRAGTFTDANGNYQLLLPAGEYFISAVKEGYVWQGQQVTVTEGQTVIVNFALIKFQPPPDLREVVVELKVETSVQLGEPVTMTLKVRNNGDQPVTLTFTSPPEADFVVMTKDGVEIWRWSHGKVFIMGEANALIVPPPVVLTPSGEKEYEVEWDQKDYDGNQVSAGEYLVQGILNTNPPIYSDEHPLQILPSNP